MKLFSLLLCLASFLAYDLSAQTPNPPSGEILLQLKKLNVLGSAMHVAAHPDDENSLLLAYLAKERLINTFYLSLTRGDGGQNLIGSEQGEYIGVIRTQELLAARRTDGAQQLFTHAYDFGFSKTREETLDFWGEDKILADVVYLIRKHRPDVLITRFPPDERAGHGHHNSSAYLALKAFKLSGDPTKYPDQLKYVKPWQPKRVVWNSYSRGFQNNEPTDEGRFISLDMSGYNSLLGKSYSEIAAESRSMHKTQGFGVAPNLSLRKDFLLNKDGVPAKNDLFDDIDVSWDRVPNGGKISQQVQKLIQGFDPTLPSASVPGLVGLLKDLESMGSENYYVSLKKEEVKELIKACLGLWFETNPTDYSTTPGGKANLQVKIVNRSPVPVVIQKIKTSGVTFDSTLNKSLTMFDGFVVPLVVTIPASLPITQPYWLRNPIKNKTFQFDEQELVGLPQNEPTLLTSYTFLIENTPITFTSPWKYKSVDPSEGEIYRPFEVRPPVTINVSEPVIVFCGSKPANHYAPLESQRPDTQRQNKV